MKKTFPHWKTVYLLCSLLYMGWVITVGDTEFNRINNQYQRLAAALDAGRITAAAVQELASECREKNGVEAGNDADRCASWPPAVVQARARKVEARLLQTKKRGLTKVVMFYTGFAVLFLLGPPLFLYLVLAGGIRIYKSVTFVRDNEKSSNTHREY
jgi:hypothetical protein